MKSSLSNITSVKIVLNFVTSRFSNLEWRLAYGMFATAGLREFFGIPSELVPYVHIQYSCTCAFAVVDNMGYVHSIVRAYGGHNLFSVPRTQGSKNCTC